MRIQSWSHVVTNLAGTVQMNLPDLSLTVGRGYACWIIHLRFQPFDCVETRQNKTEKWLLFNSTW